jgi:signal transduction histidine kinase
MAVEKGVRELEGCEDLRLFKALFDELKIGIALAKSDGALLFANRSFRSLWPFPKKSSGLEGGVLELLRSAAGKLAEPKPFLKELSKLSRCRQLLVSELRLLDGRYFELRSRPFKCQGRSGLRLWTLIDVSERAQAKEELRAANAGLEKRVAEHTADLEAASARSKRLESIVREVDERERERLGRDIHDMVGQTLTALAIRCEVLKNRLVIEGSSHALDASSILDNVKLLMSQTRSLARQLFPVAVESREINEPLQELAGSMRVSLGIDCSCKFKGEQFFGRLDAEAKINIFRIAQEAVSNAIKHGKARKIAISLELRENGGSISIANNGLPFLPDAPKGDGIGMSIMKSRAEMLGGSLAISPAAGGGAKVKCSFPLPPEPNPRA